LSQVRRTRRKPNYNNPYRKAKIKEPENDNMDNVTILAVFVLFMSCFYIFQHFMEIDLSVFGLFKTFCFFVAVTFLIPIKFYRKRLTISIYEYIILNIISLTPLFCSSFFIINASFSGATYSETYKIIDVETTHGVSSYLLENDQYIDKAYLRTINSTDEFKVYGTDSLRINFSNGLLGVRLIKAKIVK
jgi:hypothetical protein